MKLYNTLTRQVEPVQPLAGNKVTIYTCGPTVYDYPHIGNWFTFIRYDLLVRTLKVTGKNPQWAMNITDVGHLVSDADEGEDKLEKGAKREGKTAWDIAQFYSDYFTKGLERLHILTPNHLPKATEHIEEQIALIKILEEKGYAYTINDGVYYDTSKFEGYAAFARLDLDDLQAGARVEHNPEKRNASDFALWKFSPKDHKRDMEWDSPWGKGFPGWHLECSAMAMKYLGETIDIHSGGIDHIPVHHTNEIAQSEAATGKRFANYWMHANHITINDEKISKSLGNSITLEDIEKQGFNLDALRLHVIESHYRSQSKFSWESLEAAKNRLDQYQAMAVNRWQSSDDGLVTGTVIEDAQTTIQSQLENDLNTPAALAELSRIEKAIDRGGISTSSQEAFVAFLRWLDEVFGLGFSEQEDISNHQKDLVAQRDKARQSADWEASDQVRNELQKQGIGVRDTERGTIWHRL
jgi:cysteinyl-tRNA synthetase